MTFKYFVLAKTSGLDYGRCYTITVDLPQGPYSELLRVRSGTVTKFDKIAETQMATFGTAADAIKYINGEEFGLLEDLLFHLVEHQNNDESPTRFVDVREKFAETKAAAINYFKKQESKDDRCS